MCRKWKGVPWADWALSLVDLHFAPHVERFGLLDWGRFDQIVEAGYRHGMEQLEQAGEAQIASYRQE